MVYVVSYKEGIIGQTKSEQVMLQVEGSTWSVEEKK